MSRFKQPDRALAPLPPAQLGRVATAAALHAGERTPAVTQAPAAAGPRVVPRVARIPRAAPPPAESMVSKIGMLAVCGVILSPYLQDLTVRVGFKPYLSMVCLAILPLVFLASGEVCRALQSSAGKAWRGFAVFATFAIPFSYWPGGSAREILGF